MSDYWSQVQELEKKQSLATSTSALSTDVKVIETNNAPPSVTASLESNLVLPEAPIDSGYLLPQKVKVRRYVLRK